MSMHPNATLDLESAHVPASAVPNSHLTDEEIYDEKKETFAGDNDVMITAAGDYNEGEEEPTDEEYATLRK